MDQQNMVLEPRKNWWQRNWKWFVPTGCFTIIALVVVFIISIFFTVTSMMKESTVYIEAYETATTNSYVIETLGEPIEQDGMWQGDILVTNDIGEADIHIPLQGSKTTGTIHVIATKSSGTWSYSKMSIYIESTEKTIDLLAE